LERAEVERVPLDRREPVALERLRLDLFDPAEVDRVPAEREDLAREFPLLLDDELRELREAVERERASAERLRPLDSFSCTVSRLTSLLKRLLGSASYTNARLFSSNFRKKSSHEICSRVPSPLNPGKSMRRMPGSPSCSVALTVAGTPPRSSAHRRISS
jgi:hypothetical protein